MNLEIKTIRCSVCGTDLEYRYYDDIQELVIDPCPCCMDDEKEKHRETFHNEGYNEGHDDGYNTGYQEGYDSGRSEGYDDGYDEGEKYGYEEGQKEGYKTGRDNGYDEGYEEGKKIAWSDTIVDSTFLD